MEKRKYFIRTKISAVIIILLIISNLQTFVFKNLHIFGQKKKRFKELLLYLMKKNRTRYVPSRSCAIGGFFVCLVS